MPPIGNLGTVFPWEVHEALAEDLTMVSFQWRWVNRNPFFTRLPSYPAGQTEYNMVGSFLRPDSVTVTAPIAAGDTRLTLADASYLMNGDTLELTFADFSVEVMEVIGDPDEVAMTVPVKRGDAGTTPGAAPAGTVLMLISNTRTGGEEWQKAIAPKHWKRANWIQTIQHPVEVSGVLQDTTLYNVGSIAPGAQFPLDAYRMRALENFINDAERMIVYQRGVKPDDEEGHRGKTKGLRQLMQEAGSYIYQPENYGAYTPYDFLRDVNEGPAFVGGSPDLYFISRDWIGGLTRWKMPLVRIDMGVTAFDVTIDAFSSSIAPNGIFIPAPRLKQGTVIAANSQDLMLRHMRQPTWFPRGRGGDKYAGDIIARFGVQLNLPEQARFIEGITGYAPG